MIVTDVLWLFGSDRVPLVFLILPIFLSMGVLDRLGMYHLQDLSKDKRR